MPTDIPMDILSNPPPFDYPISDIMDDPRAMPSIQIDYPPNPNPTFSPDEILRGINTTNQTSDQISSSVLGLTASTVNGFSVGPVTSRMNVNPTNKANVNQNSSANGKLIGSSIVAMILVVSVLF